MRAVYVYYSEWHLGEGAWLNLVIFLVYIDPGFYALSFKGRQNKIESST
jgi:hypothetical protein